MWKGKQKSFTDSKAMMGKQGHTKEKISSFKPIWASSNISKNIPFNTYIHPNELQNYGKAYLARGLYIGYIGYSGTLSCKRYLYRLLQYQIRVLTDLGGMLSASVWALQTFLFLCKPSNCCKPSSSWENPPLPVQIKPPIMRDLR